MPKTVFYSWQSDLPNATNRSFIETALERATASLREDSSLLVDPVVDRDTVGQPGAPDISDTILGKIDAAVAVVSDVSIVTRETEGRASPNPNVLFELGYAAKSKGWERILLVQNVAYGGPELLPFDLRSRRVLKFRADPEPADDRSAVRRALEVSLKEALRLVLQSVPESLSSTPSPGLDFWLEAGGYNAPAQRYEDILVALIVNETDMDIRDYRVDVELPAGVLDPGPFYAIRDPDRSTSTTDLLCYEEPGQGRGPVRGGGKRRLDGIRFPSVVGTARAVEEARATLVVDGKKVTSVTCKLGDRRPS